MRVVIDTNVVAYYLLGTQPFAGECHRFLALTSQAIAPVLWESELANVVRMAIRTGVLPADEGLVRLKLAAQLGIESIPTSPLCQGALLRSVKSGIAVYDTLFVELAIREDCPLATFDKALLRTFRGVAVRPAALTTP